VSVLFVSVSLPVKVAKVRVPVGIVIVPLLEIELMTGVVSVLLLNVCDPVKVAIFVESAESIIEAEGNVTVPVTDNPPVVVKRPLENNLPLIDASEPTKRRLFMDASLDKNNRPLNETSDPTNNFAFKDVSDSAVSNPLVVKVLFVNVCVAVKVANVSVPLGIVIVPLLEIELITGVVSVLFVNVSLPVKVAKVRVPVGIVIVPLLEIELMTGVVSVLFVNVSVPVKVAKVRVPVGIVIVPLLEIELMTGVVSVLFVNVSVPVKVAKVRVPVGNEIVPLL
jgi:hypothetical protein